MQKLFVEEYQWLERDEMLDMIAIGQAAPGVIAVNTSILVGYKMRGIPGALITLLGTISPPLIILSIISLIYSYIIGNPFVEALFTGMRVGVAAVILDAVITMAKTIFQKKSSVALILMFSAFILVTFFHISVILVILAAGLVGLLTMEKERKHDGGKR
jgi:chromate transporter